MSHIISRALELGCTHAQIIHSEQIQVNPQLAALCQPESCDAYGLAPTCPPHVSGPEGFKRLQLSCPQALVLRKDVLEQELLGEQRIVIFRHLQEIVAELEKIALQNGYAQVYGFAGGSCKQLFCDNEADCAVLSGAEPCRYPDQARPSMSGFGIDLLALMETCCWPATFIDSHNQPDNERLSWVAALILLTP